MGLVAVMKPQATVEVGALVVRSKDNFGILLDGKLNITKI
jgi:hypothetical protein